LCKSVVVNKGLGSMILSTGSEAILKQMVKEFNQTGSLVKYVCPISQLLLTSDNFKENKTPVLNL